MILVGVATARIIAIPGRRRAPRMSPPEPWQNAILAGDVVGWRGHNPIAGGTTTLLLPISRESERSVAFTALAATRRHSSVCAEGESSCCWISGQRALLWR
jgi:hypothetical protein